MTDPNRPTVEKLERQSKRTLEAKGRKQVEKKFQTLQELKIEYVKPESIYPNAYNPNRQSERDFELLCASMAEDGFTQPIVVHRKSREIVDGEHRWRAAQRLGLKEIPVVFVDMNPDQQRISTLRHNRARGSEDVELSIAVLKDLRELGAIEHAMDSLGMTDKELNALIDDLPATSQAKEDFSPAWVVGAPKPREGLNKDETAYSSASEAIQMAAERLETKLQDVPEDDEEKRQVVLREETTWHSVILQFPTSAKPLFDLMLNGSAAHRLLQLCRYHMEQIGKPLKIDDYLEG